jgi:hypothetical protein
MEAAGARQRQRRRIAIGNSEISEVVDERAGLLEREVMVELKPVGACR